MSKKPSTTAPRRTPKVAKVVATVIDPAPEPVGRNVDSSRRSLTPTSWIEAATGVLVDHGVSQVRIDVLARQLGVTRGSFYWHFRDRDDLLRQVLGAWSTQTTEQLTMRLERTHNDDPRRQITDLISLPFRGRSAVRVARIELAIRAWAREDDAARHAVDRSDASRLAYHTQLFAALGFAPDEARSRAFLLYGYEVAESLMPGQGGPAERKRRATFVERLVQQPLVKP